MQYKIKIFFTAFLIFIGILFSLEIALRLIGKYKISKLYHIENLSTDSQYAKTILTIGESSTGGLFVERDETYPSQLKDKLEEKYPNDQFDVRMPIHVGQNTSHVSNRITKHLSTYSPDLIVLMIGYNNEWSLTESNIAQFVNDPLEKSKVGILIKLNKLRVFKVARYSALKIINIFKNSVFIDNYLGDLKGGDSIYGGPEFSTYPPASWVYNFSKGKKEEFTKLWRYDLDNILTAIQGQAVPVLLMTYHINPTYLDSSNFVDMAEKYDNVYLVRNDLLFQEIEQLEGTQDYLTFDKWHPNKKGYDFISQNAFDVITANNLLE